jgi:flotillin
MAAEAVQQARAKAEAYKAQQEAELVRFELEKTRGQADIIAKAQISKEQAEIEAEAEASVTRRKAQGDADAIYAKLEAQARGAREILEKQAEGMAKLIEVSGDANSAVKLIIADKLEELTRIQVDAIKNIKIDKVTVWDGGSTGADGKTSTADFLSGMLKSVPPLGELFNQSGMELPDLLGKKTEPINE